MLKSNIMTKIDNNKLMNELQARGLIYQFSTEKLDEIFLGDTQKIGYLGVDPTADSIHVGNLITYILAQHLINAGHKMVFLIGGATALIGDPSGKDDERPFVDETVIANQAKKIQKQVQNIDGLSKTKFVNNYDWFKKINVLDFLRDTGKHFTVNNMMKKDSVSRRLEGENGISFTEFSYALIQGYDFYHLHIQEKCDLQIGGSDQWGNIISGVEFIRRKLGKKVDALTLPLITDKATGRKFGKSAGNAIWLDPIKTSHYDFYQFWFNTPDESVIDYLKLFTFLPLSEIENIESQHQADPGLRTAQSTLAFEVSKFVHGQVIAEALKQAAELVFGNDPIWELDKDKTRLLFKYAPVLEASRTLPIIDLLIQSGLASSKREAREFLSNGAIKINGEPADMGADLASYASADLAVIQRGKRNKVILKLV